MFCIQVIWFTLFFLKLSFGVGFDSLDIQTNQLCLHYTVYSTHYTVYYTDHSLVYQEQWEGKDKRENQFKILTLIVQNLVLKVLITQSFCLGLVNHVCQTNKHKTVHTLQCTLYTVHCVPQRPEFSTLEKSEEGGHMGELIMWLISRLCWISMIGKLYSIFITYMICY